MCHPLSRNDNRVSIFEKHQAFMQQRISKQSVDTDPAVIRRQANDPGGDRMRLAIKPEKRRGNPLDERKRSFCVAVESPFYPAIRLDTAIRHNGPCCQSAAPWPTAHRMAQDRHGWPVWRLRYRLAREARTFCIRQRWAG